MRRDLFFGPLQDRISRCFILLAMLLSVGVWGQTVFSENMGTPSGTTTIAANTFQNSSTLTYAGGEQANSADVRNTTVSTAYSGASGGGNVWFTTTNAAYGFSIENINASTFTSLNLQFGYYKNSGSAHATFSVDYYNGTSWVTLVNTSATLFNESATATAGWYLSKSISLPAAAQISGLKIRFVKTGTNGIRIDDVKLTGTALPAGKTVTFNNNGGTGAMSNQTASTATNLTTNTFTRSGYNFINWNTAADASGAFYNNGASYPFTADATMYAQWKGNVTYNANGGSGTVTDSNDYSPNAPVTTQVNAYTYPGFTFAGWNTQADGLGTNYAASTASAFNFNGNITLYAKWSSAYSITFANLQFPGSHTMTEGNTFEVYGQAYAAGLTEGAGAGAGIFAEVGYNSSNTNPNTAGWIWVSAPFSSQQGNNDEFKAVLGAGLTPGTYYYATRYKIGSGGNWVYGGYNSNTPTAGGIWNGTSNVNGVLNVNADVVDFANFQYQATGNIVLGANHDVYGQVYEPGITPGAGQGTGITSEVGYSLNANTNPNTWTNWLSANYNPSVTGNNDEYTRNIGADLSLAGTYYMAFRYKKAGSSTWVYGGTNGIWNNDSAVLTVQTPQDINIKQGTDDILTNGTYAFGNQASGATGAAVVFTIQNIGQTNLDLTGAPKIVKSGTNAAEFTVDETTTTSPVTGNSSTTFTVTFSPTSLGAKAAQLSIANNDTTGGEDPYIINLTGTGTASVVSDITIKTGYTYPQNIAYTNYQATDVTGGANDIEIAKFTIRDGGATADADNLATTLTQLSFNLTNGGNVRRVAIYDGATEVAEQAGSTTHTFSGLNLTAPDGGTKDFSIRVSFKSSVTDNQQLSIGITSTTTAAATGSTFASASAGAASTSTATDNNRIEVTADRFAFVAQPTNTNLGVAMTPNVTVSANDIFGNRDLDYAGAIEITSSGTLNTTPKSATATNGLASFNTIVHTATGTGLLLTAGLTGYISGNSNAFNIVLTSATTDYFRSKQTGNWATAATWESSPDGINWLSPSTLAPTSAATSIEILNTHTITTATNAAAKNLIVRSGGILHINFALTNNGNFEVEDNGTVNFNNGSYSASGLSTTLWNGTEIFHPNSNFVIQNQASSASDFFIPANTDISANAYNGFTACFGNLIFDSSGSATYSVFGGAFTKNLTHGNLIFKSATVSSNAVRLTSSSLTTVIGGNLIMESGFNRNVNVTTAGITGSITINGDFINESAKSLTMVNNASGNLTLNVNGNIKVNTTNTNAGILNLSSAGSGTVNLKGDLTSGPSSSLVATTGTTATFNFIGTGDGSTDATTQTISLANQATVPYIIFNVNNGAYAKLKDYNLSLGTNSAFTVKNGGTLDFGFNGNTALNLIANGTGQAFSAASGSTLKITSPLGITSGAIPDYTGNVQIGATAANRVFNAGATYHYVGKSVTPQVTGNAIATSALPLTGKIIVDMESAVGQFAASASKTINAPGTLEIKTGVVTDDSSNGFIGTGNLIMTSANGKYVTSRTGTQPELSGTYTLTNGTVEFANSQATAASIRVTPEYYNINVSGSNVQSGGKNLVVNNLLKVNSASGVFTVPDELDTANPYVVTAKKGIQVVAGGKALFKNNANLIQDVDAANNGNIVAQRIAKLKFESIAKADYNYWSSPVKDQKLLYNGATPLVTSFSPGTPNNRIFEYKESTDTFVATTNPNFVAGKGYAIRAENAQNGSTYTADGTAKIFEFLGEPNNGDISTPSLTWKDANHGYNVIGNPYPSNINFDSFWSANQSRMYSTAYFWTNNQYTPNQQGSGYTGSNYAIYNGTGGNSAAYQVTSGSQVVPNEYIKPGQGFIVQTKSAGVLNFNNSMREVGVSPFFNNKTNSSKNRFWLSFTSPSSIVNDILVGYIQGASNGFEKDFDAPLLVEGSDSFFSILGAQKLAIQGKNALFTMDDVVPVGTKYFENGIYKIALSQKEGLFESQNIYLKDKLLNKTINLTSGDYTFTAVKGTDVTRFEIVYKDEAVLGTDAATKSDFTVYKDGSDYVIKSSKILGKVEVYDTAGRMLVSKKTTENNIRLNADTLTNGVYIIKAENSGDVRTKKVIK